MRRSSAAWSTIADFYIRPMSALPPEADIGGRQLDVRFVPIAEMRRPIIYEAIILAVLGFLLGLIIAAAIIHLRFR